MADQDSPRAVWAAWRVNSDEYEPGRLLGLYSTPERAQKRADEARKPGEDPSWYRTEELTVDAGDEGSGDG